MVTQIKMPFMVKAKTRLGMAVSKKVIREADSAQGHVYKYSIPFQNCVKQLAAYISAND